MLALSPEGTHQEGQCDAPAFTFMITTGVGITVLWDVAHSSSNAECIFVGNATA